MGDVNGIALARQMRTIRKDAVLIFVTNYGEYAAEGYEVSAFRFLPKLQLAEKLPDYFRQALAACRSRTRTLNVLCDGEGTNIVLDELVYVETAERMLIFHRAEPAAPLNSRMSLRTLEEKLAEEGFFAHPQQLLGQYELYCCPANRRRYVDHRPDASRQPARV